MGVQLTIGRDFLRGVYGGIEWFDKLSHPEALWRCLKIIPEALDSFPWEVPPTLITYASPHLWSSKRDVKPQRIKNAKMKDAP